MLTYGFVEEDGREEVIEDLANLRVCRDVLVMLLHELVFASGEVRKHLVVKVHVLLHVDQSFLCSDQIDNCYL